MSALSSIQDWVDDNTDWECDKTIEQNYADINKMFTDELRQPLENILKGDLPDFMVWLADKHQLECNEDIDDLDSLLDRLLDQADELLERTK